MLLNYMKSMGYTKLRTLIIEYVLLKDPLFLKSMLKCININKEKKDKDEKCLHKRHQYHSLANHQEILSSFYEKLERLGTHKEFGRYILKEGLRGKDLIDYIEQKNK